MKKLCHLTNFLEAVIVAPALLEICFQVFVAWVNLKNIFDSDNFIENKKICKKRFKHKNLVMDYVVSCNECAVFCEFTAHWLLKLTHGKC